MAVQAWQREKDRSLELAATKLRGECAEELTEVSTRRTLWNGRV